MKYQLLSLLSILTLTLGIKNIAQANSISDRSNYQNLDSRTLIAPVKSTSKLVTKPNLVAIHIQTGSSISIAALERSIHNQIDQYRQSLNLPPLTIDPTVSAQARVHSKEMAQSGTLSHTMDSVDRQRKYPTAAENIASIQDNPQPDFIAVQDWLASPAHKQNILGNYNLTGIGVAKNSQGEYFFTQIFVNK
ncbi:MAG: CAP domain-containing protein [Chamaesiphon sp.]|nr:CAP domain-containing protein [Chamaesiphon sp.]